MADISIPEFAIVGHPNEGKSSVVSTLAEDDSVKVSPFPGETNTCRVFPVFIDGREIIRFVDTPGFQAPKKTLAWMNNYKGPDQQIIKEFREIHRDNTLFRDECELFSPLARGAGIIYVVDGSRPMRNADRAEMEILRLTGLPRMAIINCKQEGEAYIEEWKSEFRRHFNAIRVFNAHMATYSERISLLESLKGIDQDWQGALEAVINAFKKDWEQRNSRTADLICTLVTDSHQYSVTAKYSEESQISSAKTKLFVKYKKEVQAIEREVFKHIKSLYRHNIFNVDLPDQSIIKEALFSHRTWQLLGLKPWQLAAAAGAAGGLIGAAVDAAAAGVTFGVFTVLGGAAGAGSALLGKNMTKVKVAGLPIGGFRLSVGPNDSIQFLYILLDRVLIYYAYVINWAHSRRDRVAPEDREAIRERIKKGYTSKWDAHQKKICHGFFKAIRSHDLSGKEKRKSDFIQLIKGVLLDISTSREYFG